MLDTHAKIALKFSGGRDSLACLELLRPIIDRVWVIWVNTGATYEGYADYIRGIGATVPNFKEVWSDQPSYIKQAIPSDICPTANFPFATQFADAQPQIVPWFECCNANLWQPLQKACLDIGATCIVTGQKASDIRKNAIRNGQVIDGIEYQMPLYDMTDEDVVAFLAERAIPLPSFYAHMETSPDCWDCTAFLDERKLELATMRRDMPDKWAVVSSRLLQIQQACEKPLNDMRGIL